MSAKTISVKDIYKMFPNNRMIDTLPLIKVELIVEISFVTFGQVSYTDENGRPWIKEFSGNKWNVEMYFKESSKINFGVFINNQFLQQNKVVTLIKQIDNIVVEQKIFKLSGEKLFEGWFKLG